MKDRKLGMYLYQFVYTGECFYKGRDDLKKAFELYWLSEKNENDVLINVFDRLYDGDVCLAPDEETAWQCTQLNWPYIPSKPRKEIYKIIKTEFSCDLPYRLRRLIRRDSTPLYFKYDDNGGYEFKTTEHDELFELKQFILRNILIKRIKIDD